MPASQGSTSAAAAALSTARRSEQDDNYGEHQTYLPGYVQYAELDAEQYDRVYAAPDLCSKSKVQANWLCNEASAQLVSDHAPCSTMR